MCSVPRFWPREISLKAALGPRPNPEMDFLIGLSIGRSGGGCECCSLSSEECFFSF